MSRANRTDAGPPSAPSGAETRTLCVARGYPVSRYASGVLACLGSPRGPGPGVLLPDLPPADLASDYRRASAAWAVAPRVAAARGRLNDAARALAAAAEAVSNLERHELDLLDLSRPAAHALYDHLDGFARHAAAAVADLDARGAGRGGNRRLPAVLGRLPPRAELILRLRREMPGAANPEIHAAASEVLTACGEDDRGLWDVIARFRRTG